MLFKAVCNLDCDLSVAKRFYWKGHLFWIWTGEWLPLFIMELAWVWLNWEEIFLSTLFWQPLVKSLDIFLICFSLIIGDENQRWYLGKETIFWKLFFVNIELSPAPTWTCLNSIKNCPSYIVGKSGSKCGKIKTFRAG